MFGIGLTICVAQVQSQLLTGTPSESASPSKRRTEKRTEATPPVESAASPSRPSRLRLHRHLNVFAERQRLKCLPVPLQLLSRHRRPANSNCRFPRLFKPKRSPSASIQRRQLKCRCQRYCSELERWAMLAAASRQGGSQPPLHKGTDFMQLGSSDWSLEDWPPRLCNSDGSNSRQPLLMVRGGIDFSGWC